MKKNLAIVACLILMTTVALSPAFSQTGKEILAKMIEAQGGFKALEAIKDTTLTGTMEMIQMGINGTITLCQKEPNKMRLDIGIMGMVITQAFDGEKGWWVNPQTGNTEVMDEKMAQDLKRQSMGNDSLLHPEKWGITFDFKGKEKVNEKEYLLLEQTLSDGHKFTHYIDPETYLTFKTKTRGVNMAGVDSDVETYQSDFKKVDGVVVFHTMTTFQDGQEFMRMTITKVAFNSGLDDSMFSMKQ